MGWRSTFLFVTGVALTQPAFAQQVRGVVRDSAGALPVPGAVVVALDSAGRTVGRNIADGAGQYRVTLRERADRIQVLRIGFRPRTIIVPRTDGEVVINVTLTAIPTLLEHVRVVAERSQCPVRADAAETLALVDQARAGLLATIVAREANPAAVTRLKFERILDANGVRPVSQTVRLETADQATVSFNATQTAVDFAQRGFAGPPGADRMFYGPDADVLLDDGFASGYCFRIAAPDREHPRLIGLAFSPAGRRAGRVDIDGALWIDSVSRALSHVSFRYLGLDELSDGVGSGGNVSFREVSPGVVLIDRWALRLVGAPDTVALAAAGQSVTRAFQINEIGGELASARWPDGRAWEAPLGRLRLELTTGDVSATAGTVAGLLNTDYRATVDSTGTAHFEQLVPGPYSVTVIDPRLAAIGLTLPVDAAFVAARDSVVHRKATVPTAAGFVGALCRVRDGPAAGAAWIIGRVGTGDGRPVANARWRIAGRDEGAWIPVVDGGKTGSSGIFAHCKQLAIGQTIQIQVWRDREAPAVEVRQLTEAVNVIPVLLPTSTVARAGGQRSGELRGAVVDSASGAGVAGAFIELVGSRTTAISDDSGRFVMADIPYGVHTAEIRTPRLDSLDAVARSTVSFAGGAPARIFLPTTGDVVSAMCGRDTPAAAGVIVGRVHFPDGAPATAGVRVIAQWMDADPGTGPAGDAQARPASRTQWRRTRLDPQGAYRVCGVPTDAPINVIVQTDSTVGAAAHPAAVRIEPASRFARLDIGLESGLLLGGAFAGTVVADSTDDPLAGVEVALPDLEVSIVTNASGMFRVNDIPPGSHRVVVRRAGFSSITATLDFTANQTIDHRIVLGRAVAAASLAPVAITEAPGVNPEFDQNRKLGLGRFLTREDLDKQAGRKLSDVLATVSSMGSVAGGSSGHGWVVGKRVPPKLAPRIGPMAPTAPGATDAAIDARRDCGSAPSGTVNEACAVTADDWREQGIYCPQAGEERQGITCACYAQVWIDGRLMNRQKPTEPFDINSVSLEELEAVEWYASPSQTPAQYSSLNSPCGVMVLWTRRSRPH